MTDLLADLRFAFRRWGKRRTFASTAVLTLALGIGAATSIFSVVNGVLLQPLPWPAADRLVAVRVARPHWRAQTALAASWDRGALSWPMFEGLRQKPQTIEAVGTYVTTQLVVNGERNEIVPGMSVSASFLPMLGVRPHLGRLFTPDEDDRPADAVLIAYETWVTRYAAAPDTLGRVVRLNDLPRTIVGVLPRGFRFGLAAPAFYAPWGNNKDRGPGNHFMRGIARLRPGISLEQAAADIAPVIQGAATEIKQPFLEPLDREQRGEFRRPLWMLMAAAVGLLLIACANVGGLFLGEASVRRHEIAVRTAVGGSRRRLVRQLMVESLALSSIAAAVGFAVARFLTPALLALAPAGLPRVGDLGTDPWVIVFAMALAMATSVVFGLAPSLALLSGSPSRALTEGGRDGGLRRQNAHGIVVAFQIALATVLLVTASLLGETVLRLSQVPTGFDPGNVLVVTTRAAAQAPQAGRAVWSSGMVQALSALPGVESVAASATPPFSGGYGSNSIQIEGKKFDRDPDAVRQIVTGDYFRLMRVPILKGRAFDETDRAGANAAVVSDAFEKQFMDGDAVGKRFTVNNTVQTIVGVVPDAKQREYTDGTLPMFYLLHGQVTGWGVANFVIRTATRPDTVERSIREAIAAHDPNTVVTRLTTMRALLGESIAEERYRALLASLFGAAALLLSAIGLYGVVARSVADRLREFGVRSALGATPGDIRMLVLTQSTRLAAAGLCVGIPGAFVASRAIGAMLYGVGPTALHTFALVAGVLAATAAIGTLAPAWRAGRVDPAVALREG